MPSHIIEYVDFSGVQLRRELSIGTASDAATIDDNPGPGRIVNKALTWGGKRVERAVTWISVRAGRGPTGPMKEIMRTIHQELQRRWAEPHRCKNMKCSYEWIPDVDEVTAPPLAPTLPSVCDWLGYAMSAAPSCPKCGLKGCTSSRGDLQPPLRPVRRLVKLLASTNQSSRAISLDVLTLLATLLPWCDIFTNIGVEHALQHLIVVISDEINVDPLLVHCRRALVTVSDVEVLSLGKLLDADIGNTDVITKLVACVKDPEKRLLALTILHTNRGLLICYPMWLQRDLQTIYLELFKRSTRSVDPVEVSVITNCFYQIVHRGFMEISLPPLVPTIKTHPELLEHLPPRLRCIIDELPAYVEREAIRKMVFWGRYVNWWRRAIWHLDPNDPEAEPDDDGHLYKMTARSDGHYSYAKIDAVWWEPPAWETCERSQQILEAALARSARGEEEEDDRARRERRARPRGWHGKRTQSVPNTVRQLLPQWSRQCKLYYEEPKVVAYFCAEYP